MIVSLLRPRQYHVLVLREDAGAVTFGSSGGYGSLASGGGTFVSETRKTAGFPLDLPAYENDLQRLALQRLLQRTRDLREGLGKLSDQLANRTELLRNTIDASQADAIGAIDDLSVKMRQREQKAQETFVRTLSNISRRVTSIAVLPPSRFVTTSAGSRWMRPVCPPSSR